MIELEECFPDPMADKVHFQMPEDLKIKNHIPEIMHDDGDYDDSVKIYPGSTHINYDTSIDYNPTHHMHIMHSDPVNVPIMKHDGNYYIDHKDLHCYMDSCGECNYEAAIGNILLAHDDPEIEQKAVIVVLSKDELNNIDYETKTCMENSEIRFEVH